MRAKLDNRLREVEMISKDGNKVEIAVDGKIYELASFYQVNHPFTSNTSRYEGSQEAYDEC